jgi:hypothetical protein
MRKVRWIGVFFLVYIAPASAMAGGLYSMPESVVFDAARNRYLVANVGGGTIVQVDEDGTQSYFYQSDPEDDLWFGGSCIVRDTLYVSGNTSDLSQRILHGFDLVTGQLVVELTLPAYAGRSIDGITSDGTTYLYVVDTGGKIFKVKISDLSYSVFASTGLANGLQACVYDGDHERLVAVEFYSNSPIKGIDLASGAVSILAATTFGNFDGITIDGQDNIYVATTNGGYIYRYEPTFTETPVMFYDVDGWPAGIHYNQRDQMLAVPCFYQDTVVFVPDIYQRDFDEDGLVDIDDNCPYHYNPGQEDLDLDSVGDPCDNCANGYNPDQGDINGNGIGDYCEVPESWDVHLDGSGDVTDLQSAIDSSTHGDTIIVADGRYSGERNRNLNFGGRQGILLYAENGPQNTIVDSEGSTTTPRRAFTFNHDEDSTFVIDGFTITGGYGEVFSGGSSGGGILVENCSPTIKNCVFVGNAAVYGGGIYAYRKPVWLINCTFADNSASYGAAIFGYVQAAVEAENCLIAFNQGGQPVTCLLSSSATLTCCDVYGNAGGDWVGAIAGQNGTNGNFSADPLMCNAGIGDVGLADETSPCLPGNNNCGELIGALGMGCGCNCGFAGDMDCSGGTTPVDVAFLVKFVYLSLNALCPAPNCPYTIGDLDCNGQVTPLDLAYLVNAVYKSQNAICDGCGM